MENQIMENLTENSHSIVVLSDLLDYSDNVERDSVKKQYGYSFPQEKWESFLMRDVKDLKLAYIYCTSNAWKLREIDDVGYRGFKEVQVLDKVEKSWALVLRSPFKDDDDEVIDVRVAFVNGEYQSAILSHRRVKREFYVFLDKEKPKRYYNLRIAVSLQDVPSGCQVICHVKPIETCA